VAYRISFGEPEDNERAAFDFLKANLPDDWALLTNLPRRVFKREIDACLISPRGAIALELKNHSGAITAKMMGAWLGITGSDRDKNPLDQAEKAAQLLKSMLVSKDPSIDGRLYIHGTVIMTNPRCTLSLDEDELHKRVAILSDTGRLVDRILPSRGNPKSAIEFDVLERVFSVLGVDMPSELRARWKVRSEQPHASAKSSQDSESARTTYTQAEAPFVAPQPRPTPSSGVASRSVWILAAILAATGLYFWSKDTKPTTQVSTDAPAQASENAPAQIVQAAPADNPTDAANAPATAPTDQNYPSNEEFPTPKRYRVVPYADAQTVDVRNGAGADYSVVGTLQKGEVIDAVCRSVDATGLVWIGYVSSSGTGQRYFVREADLTVDATDATSMNTPDDSSANQSAAGTQTQSGTGNVLRTATFDWLRHQGLNISTGEVVDVAADQGIKADGWHSEFSLGGWTDDNTGAEDARMNLISHSGRGAIMGASEPGYEGCLHASYTANDIIGISDMAPGTWICIQTITRHIAELRLNYVMEAGAGINFSVTVWDMDSK
jgi:hypothetical protein